jgi:hypothetical protein
MFDSSDLFKGEGAGTELFVRRPLYSRFHHFSEIEI